jgi:hypothetical protein
VQFDEKLDRILASLSNHLALRQQDRDDIAKLQQRVAALEAIPPGRRRRRTHKPRVHHA